MRNDVWDSTGDVTEVSGRLEIDGAEVSASELSVSRSIPSNLPAQVAGVGGFTSATGSATVSPAAKVTDKSPTPWGRGSPQPLAPATAYAVSGTSRIPVFSGLVDQTSGSASDPEVGVKLVDISDRLSRNISMQPMCRVMPAPTVDGTTNHLQSDLFSTYLVDKVLRDCGFYATPPRIGYCVLSAPLQGSAWPEIGTLTYAARAAAQSESPYWATVPWGVAAGVLRADYAPDFDRWSAIDGRFTRPMEIVLCAGPTQSDSGRVYAEWPSGARVSVAVTSARSVVVQLMFPSSLGEYQTVLSATSATLGAWRNVTVRFTPLDGGKMKIEMRTNNKGVASISGSSIPYGLETQVMSKIRVDLSQNAIGGVQVGFPSISGSFTAADHKPTAVLTPPAPFMPMTGTPAIENERAIDLLKGWAEAECAAMWIDEDGVFQWRNRTRFVAGNPVAKLTSANDLLDLNWSHDIQGAAARAVVKYKNVGVRRSKRRRITVWQGSGDTMDPGDLVEDIASPGADEAWIGVDSHPFTFQAQSTKHQFNKGTDSWVGYVAYDKDGNEHGNGEYVGFTSNVEYIGVDTYKIVQAWDGHVPSGVDHIKLQTRDGGGVLKPQWQGFNLPVLRAQSKLTFSDAAQIAAVGGPKDAPDLEHDTGWWVQHQEAVRSLAFWLAQQTSKPHPIVEGVEIMPDPRLQLGDKVQVCDPHRTGLQITGVITGIAHDIEAGDYAMSLDLLVTDILATKPTLYEYDQVFSGANMAVRDETWGTATLAQFDADPLKR